MNRASTTRSAEETVQVGMSLAQELRRGDFVAIRGELGSGKTHLVKGIAKGLGVAEAATSPTFVILNRYSGRDRESGELFLYHLDLYRVRNLSEIYDLGFEEFSHGDGVCVVEWADALGPLLPQRRYDISLSFGPTLNERLIRIDAVDRSGDSGAPSIRRHVQS